MSVKDNKTVIDELENVQNLIYEAQRKKDFLEYESDTVFSDKMSIIKNNLGSLEIPAVFSNFPIFPIDSSYYAAVKKDKEDKEKVFRSVLIATVALLALYFITKWSFINTISVIGIFATVGLGHFYNNSKKEYNKKKEVYDKSVEKFNKSNREFLSALEGFEEEKKNCIAAAKEYSKKHSAAYDEFMNEFLSKTEAETKANDRIEEINKELLSNQVIIPEYFHLIDNIIGNLKSGRADDYKEALNIAIREEKEENERQARLAQEEQRNKILAMQAEEERRHNEQMERQQMLHNQAMIDEQRKLAAKTEKMAIKSQTEADAAVRRANSLANARCHGCANYSSCPSNVKMNGGGLNCGGYKPYGAK